MYRIIGGRSSGKTGNLMLLAKEKGASIACKNPHAMRQKAFAYGITGNDFIHYSDLIDHKVNHTNVMLDEAEAFMTYCVGSNDLIGYSLTNED